MDLEVRQSGRLLARRAWVWAAVLLVPWFVAAGYLVSLPEDVLTTNLIVDDSLYYTVPARNFWLGHGLSFDGLETTNGVQILWMFVTLVFAGVISDPMTLLRSLVAASALFWLLAALGLFALLRKRSVAGATLAAVGFLWSGVHGRTAFMGMENGLIAFLSAVVLLVGARVMARGWSIRGALALGTAIAVFALSRTEAVLLGPLVGVPLLFGRLGATQPLVERVRLVVALALPGVLLVGSALLASRMAYGLWLPVSGSVKAFYEQQWSAHPVHDGFLANVFWHIRHVFYLAVSPLRVEVPDMLSSLTGIRVRLWRNLVWVTLAVTVVRSVWLVTRTRRSTPPSFWPVFAVYAFVHLILMGIALPHFTDYGKWYFACETVVLWGVIGMAFGVLRGRWSAVSMVLACLVTVAGVTSASNVGRDVTTGHLRNGGIWLEQNVPAGSVVGNCSSGLAAWYAPSLHVVNLDGLINNRRYYEDFLTKGRLEPYFEDKGIGWFSDYKAVQGWRDGITWCGRVPAERLVPRFYERMTVNDAYAIWRVLPRGESFELLGERKDIVRDHYVELGVAADVHGRFPVVSEDHIAAYTDAHPELLVARSIAVGTDLSLLHVLTTREQLLDIGLSEATVMPQYRTDLQVAPNLRLLGYDQMTATIHGAKRAALTLYWLPTGPVAPERMTVGVLPNVPASLAPVVGTCHGTLPMHQWHEFAVVVETVELPVGDGNAFELVLLRKDKPKLTLPR